MIAYLRREDGFQNVTRALLQPHSNCVAHALNLCEVYYDFFRSGGRIAAMGALGDLRRVGVVACHDMHPALWQDAGSIKSIHRRVSLADCFAIAHARAADGTVLTSDRHEMEPLMAAGICRIEFIRYRPSRAAQFCTTTIGKSFAPATGFTTRNCLPSREDWKCVPASGRRNSASGFPTVTPDD